MQKLSDAFVEQITNPALELEVVLYNIRRKGDYVPAILERSKSLDDYSMLVEAVEAYRADGYSLSDAIEKAIQRCSSCGIMPEYLQENGAEVLNMLLTEWNWDDAKEVWQEEAKEEGRCEGEIIGRRDGEIKMALYAIKNLMDNMDITAEQAMDLLSISKSERERYASLLK